MEQNKREFYKIMMCNMKNCKKNPCRYAHKVSELGCYNFQRGYCKVGKSCSLVHYNMKNEVINYDEINEKNKKRKYESNNDEQYPLIEEKEKNSSENIRKENDANIIKISLCRLFKLIENDYENFIEFTKFIEDMESKEINKIKKI